MERKKQGSLPRPSPSSTAAARASASIEDERKQNLTQSGNFDQCETPIEFDCEKTLTYVGQKNNSKALNLFVEDLNLRYKISTADIHLLEGLISVESATLISDRNKKEIRLKDAIKSARKAVSLFPNCINYVHFYAIQLYFSSNDCKGYEEVVQECHRALLIQNSIPESGVAHNMKPDLHSIIQRSNIALISIWMKMIRTKTAGEKIGSVPMKQISKDSIEVEHNESKKLNKRMEEFKKDISVPMKQISEDPIEVELRNKSKKSNKTEEERRKEIEVRVTAARILQQQQKSTSPQSKNDEEKYQASKKIDPSVAVKRNRILSYWNTLSLDKKQSLFKVNVYDLDAHLKDELERRVLSNALHVGKTNENWQCWGCASCNLIFTDYDSFKKHVQTEHMKVPSLSVSALIVGNIWVNMILNAPWHPIDIFGALRMFEGSKDTSESSPDKGKVFYNLGREWPISIDSERMELLEKVQIMLKLLLKHKYLTVNHITMVIGFTMHNIQHIPHIGSRLLHIGLEQTLFSLCFLSPSQLKKILKFLEELSDHFGLGRERDSSIDDEIHSVTQESGIKERIIISGDFLHLFLDDSADRDALLTWILEGPSSGEQLASWKCLTEDKIRCGREILQKINEENTLLLSFCEKIRKQQNHVVALETVKRLCLGERKEMEQATKFISQSYEEVLHNWKEEWGSDSGKLELEAVSNVLNEAKGLKVSQFGYKECLTGKDEDWRMQDLLYQSETCIETAFLRHKEWFSVEFGKIDAKIVHTGISILALESKLGSFSAYDYRAILLPFLKLFLQSHLEELADKYATEKSEVAKKALLAELVLDQKKSINKGGDRSKQKHKSKNKKTNKTNRKAKDLKATGGNEEIAEQTHFPVVSDDLKPKEEEFRHQLETETDAKMVEETLECQRRIKNEAKQNFQAELHEKASGITVENVVPELYGVDSKPDSSDSNVHEQLRHGANSQKIKLDQSRTYSGGPGMVLSSEVENTSISCHDKPNELYKDPSQQQKSTSPQLKNDKGENYRGREKIDPSVVVKRNQILSYWNTLSLDKKQSLFKVNVYDLDAHLKDELKSEVLSDALHVGKTNENWQCWGCPICNLIYTDYDSFKKHVQTEHVKVPSLSVSPLIVGNIWVNMIFNAPWHPVDIFSALRMFEGSNDTSESSPDKGNVFYNLGHEWPLSIDSERLELLENIQIMLKLLLKHKYLTVNHITLVIGFTMHNIQRIPHFGSRLLHIGLEQTLFSLCFLSPSQLKKILKFLEELSDHFGLGREKDNTIDDETHSVTQESGIKERIIISGDFLHLFLDDSADSDPLLTWILEGPSCGEQLASWTCLAEDKIRRGREILQKINEENTLLQSFCEKIRKQQNHIVALETVKRLCLGERNEMEQATKFISQSYEEVLHNWKEERGSDSGKLELEAVSNVLNEAKGLKVSQFGYKECLTGKDEDWRMQDLLYQSETCVETAFLRHKERFSVEFSKIDARIVHTGISILALESKLGSFSAYDHRAILLPFLKLFLQSHLEELADKYATEKSEVAKKALLAELALDEKKSINRGGDHSKQKHKSKNKKKNKANQKNKDLKATGSNEEIAEQTHFPVVSDDLKQNEEEFRHQLETETDAKMVEETLEYQTRIENEAKQKFKAELHEKASGSTVENVVPELSGVDSKPDSSDPNVHEQLRHGANSQKIKLDQSRTYSGEPGLVLSSEVENPSISCHEKPNKPYKDPSLGKTDLPKDLLGVPIQSAEGTALPSKSSTNSGGQGLLNQGTLEVLSTDQCRWKRRPGKGQNSSTKSLEEKFQAPNEIVINSTTGKNVIGTGLKNEVGENNCFLNVIIQSLWNLKRFRIEFWGRSISCHNTVGNPCVICALYDIFVALSESETETQSEAVDPTCLRVALSKFYPNSNFFQEAQMNDASEVLAAIFDCLHNSFSSGSRKPEAEFEETNCISSWDCSSNDCIAYTLFGMNIFERMKCNSCGLESRCQKYTSFFHNVNAIALRTMKITSADRSFDELLNLVAIDSQLACDPEAGGCGELNYIHPILSKPPQVFTLVLGWQSTHESESNLSATLAILTTELDIGVVYCGLDPRNKRCLVSMVCYYGCHYVCFVYNRGHGRWFLYNDRTVKVTGSWNDVLTTCKRERLQPQILFFEAVD